MEGKVWIKPHTRNGKKIAGYWRATRKGRGTVTAKSKASVRSSKPKDSKYHGLLNDAQAARAKIVGFYLHSSGRPVYYDKKTDDFYITTSYRHGKTATDVRLMGGKVTEGMGDDGNRVYLKKNSKKVIDHLLN